MITFPDGFVVLNYPGYFWHPESERVYSIKSGILTPIKLNKLRWTRVDGRLKCSKEPNFVISFKGRRIVLLQWWLKAYRYNSKNQQIQVSHNALQRSRPSLVHA
jgi:hypothetical protein